MKDFDHIKFVRYGNLNPVKHKEARLDSDAEDRSFFTAPAFKGIYACPEGLVETFLIGASRPETFNALNVRIKYLKDKNGNKINIDDFYIEDPTTEIYTSSINPKYRYLLSKYNIKRKDITEIEEDLGDDEYIWYVGYYCNKHVFSHEGELWHHLGQYVNPADIIDEKGSWTKTSYKTYVKALKRCYIKDKFSLYMHQDKKDRHGNPASYPYTFTRDHYEVFIEKVK